jgi:hypothetical protein
MANGDSPSWIIEAVIWLLSALGLFEYNRRRVDKIIAKQAEFVTREELAALRAENIADANLKHQQNLTAITNLSVRIDTFLAVTKRGP